MDKQEKDAFRQTEQKEARYYALGEAEGVMLAEEEFRALLRRQTPDREPQFASFSEEGRMAMQKEQFSGWWKYGGDGCAI